MTETATYNKLYIRILCLIVSHFHFDLKDLESWGSAIDEKMQLTVQDSMSARALRQLNFIKSRNQKSSSQSASGGVEEGKKEEVEQEVEQEVDQEVEPEMEQEVEQEEQEEQEQEMEEEEKTDSLVAEPKPLSQEDREKILRLVLMVLIPDLRKSVRSSL